MERLLVYDLGGGTFDVSMAQVENGVVEILASHGDTQLGGDDFDQLLSTTSATRSPRSTAIDLRQSLAARARVLRAAEDAKKRLSSEAVTTVEEEFIAEKNGRPLNLKMEITRHEYEELIRPLLCKTLTCLDQALSDAQGAGQPDRQGRPGRRAQPARRWSTTCWRSGWGGRSTARSSPTWPSPWARPSRGA